MKRLAVCSLLLVVPASSSFGPLPDVDEHRPGIIYREWQRMRVYPHRLRAFQLEQKGDVAGAYREVAAYLAAYPHDRSARWHALLLASESGQPARVLVEADLMALRSDDNGSLHMYRALALLQLGRTAEGRAELRLAAAMKLTPANRAAVERNLRAAEDPMGVVHRSPTPIPIPISARPRTRVPYTHRSDLGTGYDRLVGLADLARSRGRFEEAAELLVRAADTGDRRTPVARGEAIRLFIAAADRPRAMALAHVQAEDLAVPTAGRRNAYRILIEGAQEAGASHAAVLFSRKLIALPAAEVCDQLALARLLEMTGEKREAATVYEAVSREGHATPKEQKFALTALGFLYYDQGLAIQAAEAWSAADEMEPAGDLRLQIARAHLAAAQPAAALDHLAQYAGAPQDKAAELELRSAALKALNRIVEADAVQAELNHIAPTPDRLLEQAALRQRLGDLESNVALSERAVALAPGRQDAQLALAYANRAAGRNAKAVRAFESALILGEIGPARRSDLAFTYADLGRTGEAENQLERAIDLYIPPAGGSPEQQRLYELRQANATFGDRLSLTGYSNFCFTRQDCMEPPNQVASQANRSAGGLELAWRPPGIGYRGGRSLHAYVRSLWSNDPNAGPVPERRSVTLSVGLRWKPLAAHNFSVSAEKVAGLGQKARGNVLIGAAYGISTAMDIQPRTGKGQLYYELFIGSGQFLERPRQTLLSAEGRIGISLPLSARTFSAPFLSTSLSSVSRDGQEMRVSVGAGYLFQPWYGGDRYHAARTYIGFIPRIDYALSGPRSRRSPRAFVTTYFRF